jgi:hypothetical protein
MSVRSATAADRWKDHESRRKGVVLDENDKVLHSELVPEIAEEPNYEAALASLK